jgi:hypothetical protein
MNTALLRAATRHADGTRYWTIPGAPNAAKLVPGNRSFWNVAAFHWPHYEANRATPDWIMRGVRLDWHRSIAKAEARKLIAAYTAANA